MTRRSCSHSQRHPRLLNARQLTRKSDDKLGELVDSALDRDRSAVLLGHDVVTDRETKPGAFAGRLGGEERREHLCLHLRRDANPVVADACLDLIPEVARHHPQDRTINPADFAVLLAFLRGIKAVSEQVEKHAGDILGNQLDRTKTGVEVALDRDVEFLILSAGAMVGEIERLLDQRIEACS
jgi:hypothetical protein